jgi:hypothetical protein
MGLGSVVASAAATQGSLKKLIRLRLGREEKVPYLDEKGYLRVSALADLCPREEVLASTLKFVRMRTIDADLGMIFAYGTALHWILQNKVVGDTGAFYGVWHCVVCAAQYGAPAPNLQAAQSLVRRPKACICGCEDFHFREQKFVNEEYRIGGHPDGFLVLQGMPGLGIAEFKSVGPRSAWEVRSTPNLGHVIQVQTYLWLTGLQWGKILYWEKGGHGMSALFEHTVDRDEGTIESIQRTIRSIWNGVQSEILPDRVCTSSDCPRASKCQLKNACFEEEAA